MHQINVPINNIKNTNSYLSDHFVLKRLDKPMMSIYLRNRVSRFGLCILMDF